METRIIFFIVIVILLVILIGISYNYYEKSEFEEIIHYDYNDCDIFEEDENIKKEGVKIEKEEIFEERLKLLQEKIDVLNLENSKLFSEVNTLKTNYLKILNTPPILPVCPPPPCPVPVCPPAPCSCKPPPCPVFPTDCCPPPPCFRKEPNFVRGGGGTVTSTLTLNGKGNKCMINLMNGGDETSLFNFTDYKNILSADCKTIFMDESALLLKCVVGVENYYMPLYKVCD
jgi:hypothetical protein